MSAEIVVAIEHDSDVVMARQRGRELAVSLGFSVTEQTLIAAAISEVARNIVSYAKPGEIVLSRIDEGLRRGLSVAARDKGPGIADVPLAMRHGCSTTKTLGVGLPGAKRVMDEFEVVSVVGKGTTVTMRKWVAAR